MPKDKPEIRFAGFTDAWEKRRLGELATIQGGGTPSSTNSDYWNGDINWFTPTEVSNTGYVKESVRKITNLGLKKSSAKLLPKGTVLMTSRAGVGDMGILTVPAATNQGFQSMIPNEEVPSYFLYSMQSFISKKANRLASGSTFSEISGKQVSKISINIPAEKEEKIQIGKLFEQLNNFITVNQRKVDLLKELKKGFLQKMFPKNGEDKPEIRFAGYTDVWEKRKLGEIGETHSGIGFPENEQGGKKGIPFFKVSDMNNLGNEHEMNVANNYVNDEQLERRKWKVINNVPGIIFAKVGAAIMLNRKRLIKVPFLMDNNTMEYAFDRSWNVYFGKTLFETLNLPKYAQVGALPSYNGSDIETISVEIPEKDEQERIGTFFQRLDQLITVNQRRVDLLKQEKKALLQKMFV